MKKIYYTLYIYGIVAWCCMLALFVPYTAQATTPPLVNLSVQEKNIIYQLLDRGFIHKEKYAIPLAFIDRAGIPSELKLSVSQYIAHSNRTYSAGDDIVGLLVLITNISTSAVTYTEHHSCPLGYRIYTTDWRMLYNSDEADRCHASSPITVSKVITIDPLDVHAYEIVHSSQQYTLPKGEYIVALSYNGVPAGVKTITITE
jgi:hypothetical protein